jgi:uncharacterized membrane protein
MGTTAPTAAEPGLPRPAPARLDAVDALRGVVMVLMALDHVRDFLGPRGNPEDLATASTALFLTRWVTHFCAPVFVFLAGTGAYLRGAHSAHRFGLAWFLLTRGLWLLVLELTLVYWAWSFSLDYRFTVGQVIWATGASMVALSALVFLPAWAMGLVGVVILATHNLFDGVRGEDLGPGGWIWDLLHNRRAFEPVPGHTFLVLYPLLPWVGVMAAGYGFGAVLRIPMPRRRTVLLALGAGMTLGFVALRAANGYGDPRPWSVQENPVRTVLSFLNCEKYPPSLLFVLMTLGPAILLMAVADWLPKGLKGFFTTFGRVPLFYYLLHFVVIHGLAVAYALARDGDAGWLFGGGLPIPPAGYGLSLPVLYLVWAGVVLALWPVCWWYAGVKRKHPGGALSYL